MTNESEHDGRTDFDFLIGSWNIQNRRLKERLKGCTEWEEFEGTGKVRHILGGLGNLDEAHDESWVRPGSSGNGASL